MLKSQKIRPTAMRMIMNEKRKERKRTRRTAAMGMARAMRMRVVSGMRVLSLRKTRSAMATAR